MHYIGYVNETCGWMILTWKARYLSKKTNKSWKCYTKFNLQVPKISVNSSTCRIFLAFLHALLIPSEYYNFSCNCFIFAANHDMLLNLRFHFFNSTISLENLKLPRRICTAIVLANIELQSGVSRL